MPVTPVVAAQIDPRSGSINGFVSKQTLASAVAITDTSAHDPTTDAGFFFADCTELGGPKLAFVLSNFNQAGTIQVMVSSDKATFQLLGSTVAVSSGAQKIWIDQNTAGCSALGQPYPYVAFQFTATVGPASGTITITLFSRSA